MRLAWLVLLLASYMLGPATPGLAQHPARHVDEEQVHTIATQLRCVVCQNLSVADSPSEMANQMRAVIRERLAAGQTPGEVVEYFVDKYGEWILLEPRRRGFTALVWLIPPLAVLIGLGVVTLLIVRWTRRPPAAPTPARLDPAMSERIRREMEAEP
ncbi:MAG TPA: cytochrome c-type biogenesis protein [Methylomirabilota bacterium]|jgi:cytochrome c-type biogenesis protein CcmH